MRMVGWIGLGAAMAVAVSVGTAWALPGNALDFDGINDKVVVSDTINLTGPLTLEAWIRCDAFVGGRILSNRDAANAYELDVDSIGNLRFSTNGSIRGSVNISAHLGQWVHVAVTWAGLPAANLIMYVNGQVELSSYTSTPIIESTADLVIGNSPNGALPFDGSIDEVRIFDTVVGPETILVWMTRHYGAGHPDSAHLQGAWNFEESSGQVVAGTVPGRDGQLGSDPGVDSADPVWITSGMVGATESTWGGVKAIYRP